MVKTTPHCFCGLDRFSIFMAPALKRKALASRSHRAPLGSTALFFATELAKLVSVSWGLL